MRIRVCGGFWSQCDYYPPWHAAGKFKLHCHDLRLHRLLFLPAGQRNDRGSLWNGSITLEGLPLLGSFRCHPLCPRPYLGLSIHSTSRLNPLQYCDQLKSHCNGCTGDDDSQGENNPAHGSRNPLFISRTALHSFEGTDGQQLTHRVTFRTARS